MKIIIDMFGGDNAPEAPLEGAALAAAEYGVDILAVGDRAKLEAIAGQKGLDVSRFEFYDAPVVMPVCADPTEAVKSYKDSSLTTCMRLLAEGRGDAVVGAGSTGAMVVAATLVAKRLHGVKRAALASVIPGINGQYMLLDLGANVECRPEMLSQFGLMGSIYMERVMGVASPKVALINIGAEETKGRDLQVEAYQLMKAAPYNFVGNIEPRELPFGGCDVAVADGWTGNIVLKLTEGLGSGFGKMFKAMLMKNVFTKFAALFLKSGLRDFKKKLDYTEAGGAPLLGIARPVIKAHGSSNATAFKNAVRQAKAFVEGDVNGAIAKGLEEMGAKEDEK